MIAQKHNHVIGIIPARFHSTRLNGKPLAIIDGKPMIQHVYERANKVLNKLLVATDDQRIFEVVKSFNGNVVMTDPGHTTGTNRCLEAFNKWKENKLNNASIVLNIQGDEPLLNPSHIEKIISSFNDPATSISTLGLHVKQGEQLKEGKVYLVKDKNDFALYFSRFPVPYFRGIPKDEWSNNHQYYQHIGLYGFKTEALIKFVSITESTLEKTEKLEQLRWLESGEKIKVSITDQYAQPVDTPEDLEQVRAIFKMKGR